MSDIETINRMSEWCYDLSSVEAGEKVISVWIYGAGKPPFPQDFYRLLATLKHVKELVFDLVEIDDPGMRKLAKMTSLRKLSMMHRLPADYYRHLGSLVRLEELALVQAELTADVLAEFRDLKRLSTLNLTNAKIDDDAIAELAHFPLLQELELSATEIRGRTLSRLAALRQLKRLDLSYCFKLVKASVEEMIQLKSLRTLDLRQSIIGRKKVTQDLAQQIRAEIPCCFVDVT